MIPLGDDHSARKTTPVITYVLIILNFLVFFLELSAGEPFIVKWAFVPSHFMAHPISDIPTLFSSMFMHGGWAHILGNMLYLWIFGGNVEDRFGKIAYLVFYLFCGIAATFAQLAFNAESTVPNLGASGAIAGVLGAYIVLFPQEKIKVLIGRIITQMPALYVIGFWFILQFISSVESTSSQGDVGGVAYLAHVGGFIVGLVIALFFAMLKGAMFNHSMSRTPFF